MVQNLTLPLTIKAIKVDPDFDFAKYIQLFTPQVIKSIYSYKFHKDQVVKFCSELLKRYYLSDLSQQDPNDLDITYNKYDKPFLKQQCRIPHSKSNYTNDKRRSLHDVNEEEGKHAGEFGLGCGIKFNISHAKEYVVIAVIDDPDYEIGIDIEYVDRKSTDFRDLAKIVYSDYELAQIKDVNDFYNFWTKKESLIKARGTGFGEDFYKTTNLTLDDHIQTENHMIYTTLFKNDYYISICLLQQNKQY